MAIENEFKFILKQDRIVDLMDTLRIQGKNNERQFFHQIYISNHARLRAIANEFYDKGDWDRDQYDEIIFTYKQMIEGTLLEFETYDDITDDQFALACRAAVGSLRKYRYSIREQYSHTYEFDFLLGENDDIYFAMLEVEVPVGTPPIKLPAWIEPFVELAIPQQHNFYFTNFRLSNTDYAKTAVEQYKADIALIA